MDIDPIADPALERYDAELTALMLLAQQRKIDRHEFQQRLRELVEATLIALFLLAGGNLALRRELDETIRAHAKSVKRLAADIYDGRYDPRPDADDAPSAPDAPPPSLASRIRLWVISGVSAFMLGRIYHRDQSRMLQWKLGATEQHCKDCARLHNQVHTAGAWRASGWRPQIRRLECKGYRCDCSLIEVPAGTPERGRF